MLNVLYWSQKDFNSGKTPLDFYCEKGHIEIVEYRLNIKQKYICISKVCILLYNNIFKSIKCKFDLKKTDHIIKGKKYDFSK